MAHCRLSRVVAAVGATCFCLNVHVGLSILTMPQSRHLANLPVDICTGVTYIVGAVLAAIMVDTNAFLGMFSNLRILHSNPEKRVPVIAFDDGQTHSLSLYSMILNWVMGTGILLAATKLSLVNPVDNSEALRHFTPHTAMTLLSGELQLNALTRVGSESHWEVHYAHACCGYLVLHFLFRSAYAINFAPNVQHLPKAVLYLTSGLVLAGLGGYLAENLRIGTYLVLLSHSILPLFFAAASRHVPAKGVSGHPTSECATASISILDFSSRPGMQLTSTGLQMRVGISVLLILLILWDAQQVGSPLAIKGPDVVANNTNWVLIITSGGGGGHLAASNNLAQKILRSRGMSVDAPRHVNKTGQTHRWWHLSWWRSASVAPPPPPPVETIDIMQSECTNLLGSYGVPMGGWIKEQWNGAQRKGNIGKLKSLSKKQKWFQVFFAKQCHNFMHGVISGRSLPHLGPPRSIIMTQPSMLEQVTGAVEALGMSGRASLAVHVYLTDLPFSPMFFNPIKELAQLQPQKARHVVLHTVAPARGGVTALAERSGLPPSQIVVEPFMPIAGAFTDGSLPRPRTSVNLTLKAQLPEEEEFLGGSERAFHVNADDMVVLVMLGSQPTEKAMHNYLERAKQIRQHHVGTCWVFLGCGKASEGAYQNLYVALARKALAFNKKAESSGGFLRLLPFTGQPVQHLLGRADVTVTRSGGMTAGELLALAARGDRKRFLIHLDAPRGLTAAPAEEEARAAWEDAALERSMVPWEVENARHLIQTIHAVLVMPGSFADLACRLDASIVEYSRNKCV
eukprot:TRINITY_DN105896_c0_g1_i1.p1 TRINITY_DN105896_c0_g1~~TRINITY_DN105896_c0_g1_i1.p1  ORF type:complete len:796 (-),score=102.99 TRINITY_DN105896_c0_g1_i1:48-2435(-)